MKWIKRLFVQLTIVTGICLCAAGAGLVWWQKQAVVKSGSVTIFQGASTKQVSEILKNNNLIEHEWAFYYYTRLKTKYEQKIKGNESFEIVFKAGTYAVKKGTYDEVIHQLETSKGIVTKQMTFAEGLTIKQMTPILVQKGFGESEKSVIDYLNNEGHYAKWKTTYPWLPDKKEGIYYLLEGYLMSNTYQYEKHTTLEEIIHNMLEGTNEYYKLYETSQNRELTFDQVITLASIVERESKFPQDRGKVAAVFYNRLHNGMKLQSDITAIYAHGIHKILLSNQDIAIDSPYNTYQVSGLPIGPIGSPSKESIRAVLEPDKSIGEALYFYARPSGETFYTKTLSEHEEVRKKWEHEWKELVKKNG